MVELKNIDKIIDLMDQSTLLVKEALLQHYKDIDAKCEKKLNGFSLLIDPSQSPAYLCKKIKLTNSEVIQTIADDTYKTAHKGVHLKRAEAADLCEEYRQVCIDAETIKYGILSSISTVEEIMSHNNERTTKSLTFLGNIKQGLSDGSLKADFEMIQLFNQSYSQLRDALLDYSLATLDQISAHLCKNSCIPTELIKDQSVFITPTSHKSKVKSPLDVLSSYVRSLDDDEIPQEDVLDRSRYNKRGNSYGALYALLKGEKAECQLCDYLQRNLQYSYILHGVRTKRYVGDGKYSESDVVVINRHGVFSIEVKNVLKISEYRVYPNNHEESIYRFKNDHGSVQETVVEGFTPLSQSSEHARSLRTFMIENNIIDELSTLSVVPMVAILNSSTKIVQKNNAYIKNIHHLSSTLIDYLEDSSAKEVMSDAEAFRIYNLLKEKSVALGQYNYAVNIKTIVSSMEIDAQRLFDALKPISQNSLLLIKAMAPIKAEKKKKQITVNYIKPRPITPLTFTPKTAEEQFRIGYTKNKNLIKQNIWNATFLGIGLAIIYIYISYFTNESLFTAIQVITFFAFVGYFFIALVTGKF